jgi:hypothetical protein
LLSIDVDGMDYWIWKALTYEPRVVVIEYNPRHEGIQPYDADYIYDGRTDSDTYGASKEEMIKLGKEKGYKLKDFNSDNLFFEREV